MKDKLWLLFILITVVTWGVWGAFSGYQIQNGIPDTVVYILWALSMVPCAIVALCINNVSGDRHYLGGYLPQGESDPLAGGRYRGCADSYPAALSRDRAGGKPR